MMENQRPQIDRLLRGISTDHVETVRDAWRELAAGGNESIMVVKEKLASPAWAAKTRGPLHKYLGVLLSLLDELDPAAFAIEIDRLLSSDLHSSHRMTVKLLSRRCKDRPLTHIGPNIPVFVAEEIAAPALVINNLQLWSKTSGLKLDGIRRVDIIARHPHLDYLGCYNLFFSGIVLTWPTDHVRGMRLWYRRLDAEFTFYHEVGHHACRHIEGGQVVEQEQEADDYARLMMRKSRPIFTCVGSAMLFLLRPILRLVLGRKLARGRRDGTSNDQAI